MPSYAHKKLVEHILRIDQLPNQTAEFQQWIKAGQHLEFLVTNAASDEIIVFGSGPFTYIHSIAVPNDALFPLDSADLLLWNGGPYTSVAGYACGGGRDDMWIDRRSSVHGSKALERGKDLIFCRTFEGWSAKDRTYVEIDQEYSHLSDIHWRPAYSAYCRYDENGDLDHVVSVKPPDGSGVTLVSFTWHKLEEYLAISNSSLVRMFDFTLLRRETFSFWPGGAEKVIEAPPTLFYRQKVAGDAAYTRGVQIIQARRSPNEIVNDIKNGWRGRRAQKYVEFIAYDWRNSRIAKISTDPRLTTNYFVTKDNSLPFELSPAFFRPEVLSKYKTDRDKYKVSDRRIECRAAWSLKGYDVNEAGQIHAYLCDLRALPYSEQLHWASFNEEPKASISERAYINDFKGEFVTFQHPREKIISILKHWHDDHISWWTLRDNELFYRANPPLTSSRDEWGDAFMDISQLVVEGFELKVIRRMLDSVSVAYDQKEQSIILWEKLIMHTQGAASAISLDGIRAAQLIRSKVKGHAGSSQGKQVAEDALARHGSLAEHFRHVCQLIVAELEIIERATNYVPEGEAVESPPATGTA
jgi:hypothetical protein